MDELDIKILKILSQNSKRSNKEIGEMVHLTGQSVSQRILNLYSLGVIKKYTVNINHKNKQFIRLFMENNQFSGLEAKVHEFEEIDEFYKVSGHACYMIVAHFNQVNLNNFIESVAKWARCSVDTVVSDKMIDNG